MEKTIKVMVGLLILPFVLLLISTGLNYSMALMWNVDINAVWGIAGIFEVIFIIIIVVVYFYEAFPELKDRKENEL